MSITKTIGGDRVGSGKKMKAHLMNYYRSTHNLSEKFASSMGCGILYPCLCKLAMRGDTFDISLEADARTIPTKGPLFGSYKMQLDVYQCPVRLYQALLHNNPLAIGLNMSQIKFPVLNIHTQSTRKDDYRFSNSSLLKYLGMSGTGTPVLAEGSNTLKINRRINAIPALAYYDIFKTYYANKQEEVGYVITPNFSGYEILAKRLEAYENGVRILEIDDPHNKTFDIANNVSYRIYYDREQVEKKFGNVHENFSTIKHYLIANTYLEGDEAEVDLENLEDNEAIATHMYVWKDYVELEFTVTNMGDFRNYVGINPILFTCTAYGDTYGNKIELKQFDLKNIDDMRYDLLSHHELGSPYIVTMEDPSNTPKLPYRTLVDAILTDTSEINYVSNNYFAENGLVLKTYQNDIFNNWLNSEWIEGENGIAELSKVEVVDGAFTMDALNFAQKLYNMLNRIAIAGATYEDWQDVVYEEVKRKQIESPIYCGGMSQEVMFDEIIQTAPADGDPLGTLGGRGRLNGKRKGGRLHIKCDEACFIIGIISLTPRTFQTQGNEFYMTDVLSMDDIHKPAMDGIGFQDLIGERMAWWDTKVDSNGQIKHRSKIGKLPSWIEYMTSYDRAYGDFAETEGKGYMILNRNYERDEETDGIKDATTYIDPAKYNYVFAYTELEAQNFWVEVKFNIKARRLMSARLIPNV